MIRERSKTTLKNPGTLMLKTSGRAARQMIRELNDELGMSGYEIATSTPLEDGEVEMEFIVPAEMVLLLKLRWSHL